MIRDYVDAVMDRAADRIDAFNKAVNPVARRGGVDAGLQAEVDAMLRPALARHVERARAAFVDNDEFVFVDDALPRELIDRVRREVDTRVATRSLGIWHRRAGSVGYRRILGEAPVTAAVYRSQAMLDWLSAVTGKCMLLRPDDDDHACTYYVYTRPGDHMTYHLDTCGCEDGAAYSMIVGVIDESTQRLMVKVRGEEQRFATPPGALAAFSGAKCWHGVTPLGRGERRVALGLAYVTTTYRPPWRKLVKVSADAVFHFGLGGLVDYARRSSGRRSR